MRLPQIYIIEESFICCHENGTYKGVTQQTMIVVQKLITSIISPN